MLVFAIIRNANHLDFNKFEIKHRYGIEQNSFQSTTTARIFPIGYQASERLFPRERKEQIRQFGHEIKICDHLIALLHSSLLFDFRRCHWFNNAIWLVGDGGTWHGGYWANDHARCQSRRIFIQEMGQQHDEWNIEFGGCIQHQLENSAQCFSPHIYQYFGARRRHQKNHHSIYAKAPVQSDALISMALYFTVVHDFSFCMDTEQRF
jgi:hypothetical protein